MWHTSQSSYTRASPRSSSSHGDHQDMLRIACLQNDVETIRKLCKKHKVNIEIEDSHCTTPLMLACYYGCYDVVDELISNQKASVDHGDVNDVKPLHYACEQQHIRIVELLIEQNADIHSQTKKGWTALHYAAESGNFDLIKLLLLRGGNKTIKDQYQQSPMDIAAKNKIADIICLFHSTNNQDIKNLISNNSTSHHRNSTKSFQNAKSHTIELERERIMRGEISNLKDKIQIIQYENDIKVDKLTKRVDTIEEYVQGLSVSVHSILSSTPNVSIVVPKPTKNEHQADVQTNTKDIALDLETPMTELNSPFSEDRLNITDFEYDTDEDSKMELAKMPSLRPEAHSLELGSDYDVLSHATKTPRLAASLSNIIDVEEEMAMSPIREDPVTPYRSDDPTPLPNEYNPVLQNKYQSSPGKVTPINNTPYENMRPYRRSDSRGQHRRNQTDNHMIENRYHGYHGYHQYSNPPPQFQIDEYLKIGFSKSDPETHITDDAHAYPDDNKDSEEVIISEEEYAKLMGVRRNSDPSPHGSPLRGYVHPNKVPPLSIPNTIGIINGTISPDTIDAVSKTHLHHEEMTHQFLFDPNDRTKKPTIDLSGIKGKKNRPRSANSMQIIGGNNNNKTKNSGKRKNLLTNQYSPLRTNQYSPFNKQNVNVHVMPHSPSSPNGVNKRNPKRLYNLIDSIDASSNYQRQKRNVNWKRDDTESITNSALRRIKPNKRKNKTFKKGLSSVYPDNY